MGKASRANKKRKHMLRDIEFEAHDPVTKDEYGFPSIISRAWLLYYQAIASNPSGNVEETAKGVTVFNKLKVSSEAGSTEGTRRIKKDGTTLRLTNEELDYSKKAVSKIRDQVPISQGDALMYLDQLFAGAKEIDESKLVAAEIGRAHV